MTKYRKEKITGNKYKVASNKKRIECEIRIPFYTGLKESYTLSANRVIQSIYGGDTAAPSAIYPIIYDIYERYDTFCDKDRFDQNLIDEHLRVIYNRLRLPCILEPVGYGSRCIFKGVFDDVVDMALQYASVLSFEIRERYDQSLYNNPDAGNYYPSTLEQFLENMTPETELSFLIEFIVARSFFNIISYTIDSIIEELDKEYIMFKVVDETELLKTVIGSLLIQAGE